MRAGRDPRGGGGPDGRRRARPRRRAPTKGSAQESWGSSPTSSSLLAASAGLASLVAGDEDRGEGSRPPNGRLARGCGRRPSGGHRPGPGRAFARRGSARRRGGRGSALRPQGGQPLLTLHVANLRLRHMLMAREGARARRRCRRVAGHAVVGRPHRVGGRPRGGRGSCHSRCRAASGGAGLRSGLREDRPVPLHDIRSQRGGVPFGEGNLDAAFGVEVERLRTTEAHRDLL